MNQKNNITFLPDSRLAIAPSKRVKKLTGTRFASVLGLNSWNTPFKTWCEITRTYEEPFIGNKYTEAGKIIEPKVADYIKKNYFLADLKSPEDIYGKDYFKKTYGNFYDHSILGGMWDYIGDDYIVEVKTSSRPQDWLDGPPEYYLLQACLYAYLSKVDNVYIVVSFLEPKDYDNPEDFKCSFDNTRLYEYSMSRDFPDFEDKYVAPALMWWDKHVITGVSPHYDDKDEEIIKELKTKYYVPENEDEATALLHKVRKLESHIATIKIETKLDDLEKELKTQKELLKKMLMDGIDDTHNKSAISYMGVTYELSAQVKSTFKINEKKLKEDGIYQKYAEEKTTTTYVLRTKKGDE